MNLLIFTPVIESSAIARVACLISKKLIAEGHKLTIVRTEDDPYLDHPIHPFEVDIISGSESAKIYKLADSADALIYQIGNHYPFHKWGVFWLSNLSGIVCLHDFYLSHLFYVWAQTNYDKAKTILEIWYGKTAAQQFFNFQTSDAFIEWSVDNAPMTEWICSMAKAVVTHSDWCIDRMLNSCPGSVNSIPLPYESPLVLRKEKISSFPKRKGEFRILTIGHVNTNKRVHSVIQAISKKASLRKKIIYHLVGSITPEMKTELMTLSERLQVNLIISGEVDHVVLGEAINETDLISCLRWPALETASASAIEAMMSAKPILVTNTGFYQEIPNDCAIKINPENEIKEIQRALQKFIKDPNYFKFLALKGYEWSTQKFTAENYVSKLVNIIIYTSTNRVLLDAFQFFAKYIHEWGASNPELLDREYLSQSLSFFK